MKQLSEVLPPMQVTSTQPEHSLNMPQHTLTNGVGRSIMELVQTKPSLTRLRMILDQVEENPQGWTMVDVNSLRTYLQNHFFQSPSGEQMAVTTKQLISMANAYGYKFNEQAYIGEMKENLRKFPSDLLEKAVSRIRERSSNSETFRIPMIGDLREAIRDDLFEREYPLLKLKTIEFLIQLKGR